MEQGMTVFHKDETEKQKTAKPRRGPLDVNEQIALIKVCEKRAKYKEISEFTSAKFWIEIEVALEREIGRRYSHYSCRRRITEYIAQRAICRDAIKNGQPAPLQLIDPEIRSMLDAWKEMDEFKEQLEKERALSQLVGQDPEVPQTNKLQRVADWVKSLPDPEPQSIFTPPTTESSPSLAVKDEASLWAARYRKAEEDRFVRCTQLRNMNFELSNSRQLLSNIKYQLSSTLQDPHHMQILTGVKRPREDETPPDRAAQRPRTQLTDLDTSRPVLKQSPGNSHVLLRSENVPAQPPIETVFGKFWDSMLPYFKERALKEGLSLTKSESIMHELFKEVGSAMTRAFMKLEQSTRNPSAL
ncbi:hypothetical protein BJY01DRAFT_232549 [Aspergillus pseudoustus]|uniref:Uncharacterized protein n=1 Tax=Aspergillus pseudoustus TaxID=1810923 RepID=A0ABR4KJQ4_9EURO